LHIQSLQVLHRKLCAFLFQDSAANFRIELAGKPNAVHHGIALLLARRLAHAGEPISQDEGLHIIDGVRKANLHTDYITVAKRHYIVTSIQRTSYYGRDVVVTPSKLPPAQQMAPLPAAAVVSSLSDASRCSSSSPTSIRPQRKRSSRSQSSSLIRC